jgi:hypothetical protein
MGSNRRINNTAVAACPADGARGDPCHIPLSRSVFWAPMAITLMGGLLAGTVLTLLFLPALWFGVQKPDGTTVPPAGGEHAEAAVEIKALQAVSLAVPG